VAREAKARERFLGVRCWPKCGSRQHVPAPGGPGVRRR
jgi:hypothetical protein